MRNGTLAIHLHAHPGQGSRGIRAGRSIREVSRKVSNAAVRLFERSRILGARVFGRKKAQERTVQSEAILSGPGSYLEVPAITRQLEAAPGQRAEQPVSEIPGSVILPCSQATDRTVPAIKGKTAIMEGDIFFSGLGEAGRGLIEQVPAITRRNVPMELLGRLNSNGSPWTPVFTKRQRTWEVKGRIARFPEVSISYGHGTLNGPHIVNVQGRPEMRLTTGKLKRLADILELEARIARFPQITILSGPINPLERNGRHHVRISNGTVMILTTELLGRLVEEFELQGYRDYFEAHDRMEEGWKKGVQ